jgi:hypothetical protein
MIDMKKLIMEGNYIFCRETYKKRDKVPLGRRLESQNHF